MREKESRKRVVLKWIVYIGSCEFVIKYLHALTSIINEYQNRNGNCWSWYWFYRNIQFINRTCVDRISMRLFSASNISIERMHANILAISIWFYLMWIIYAASIYPNGQCTYNQNRLTRNIILVSYRPITIFCLSQWQIIPNGPMFSTVVFLLLMPYLRLFRSI